MTEQRVINELLGMKGGVIERIVPGEVPEAWELEHVARYRWAVRELRGTSARSVLDLACGVGYGSDILEGGGYQVVSADLFRPGIKFGVRHFRLRRGVVLDAHDLPFRQASFDAAVSLETIEHVARPDVFIQSIARVLKPGGVLLLSTPNGELTESKNVHHVHEFTLNELSSLLRSEGFSVSAVLGQHFHLRGNFWAKVMGLRRFSWRVLQSTQVRRFSFAYRDAVVWCVVARPVGPQTFKSASRGR